MAVSRAVGNPEEVTIWMAGGAAKSTTGMITPTLNHQPLRNNAAAAVVPAVASVIISAPG